MVCCLWASSPPTARGGGSTHGRRPRGIASTPRLPSAPSKRRLIWLRPLVSICEASPAHSCGPRMSPSSRRRESGTVLTLARASLPCRLPFAPRPQANSGVSTSLAGGAFNSAPAGTVNRPSHMIPGTSRAIERRWLPLRRAHRGATATGPLNNPGVEPSGRPGNGPNPGREQVRRVFVSIERESTREFWPFLDGFRPGRRGGRPEDRARRAARERRDRSRKSLWLSGICGRKGERPAGWRAVKEKAPMVRGRKRMAPH